MHILPHTLPDSVFTRRAKELAKAAWQVSLYWLLPGILLASLLSGCGSLAQDEKITPLPTEFWGTAAAMTLEARGMKPTTPTAISPPMPSDPPTEIPSATPTTPPTATDTQAPTLTAAPSITLTAVTETAPTAITVTATTAAATADTTVTADQSITDTLNGPSTTPHQITLPGAPEETPPPEIPEAKVQIYQLGELSIVTSPILVSSRLTSRNGKVVRIELTGEDGRMLARDVRVFQNVPWQAARLSTNLEFEISGVSEIARLTISVEDEYGRLIDVNSVNLILLSTGVTDLNPYSALWQRIIIQEPAQRALIQGGALVVSGRVRPTVEQPLKVMLITEDGRTLGQRLASVSIPIPGDYGTFAAEVPYTVSEITNALLVVYEDGGQISEISHLASLGVILAP